MKIGFTASSFDLLPVSQIAMLEECKDNCDFLIVGLNTNPMKKGKYPVQGLFERWKQLDAIKYVDKIIPYNGEGELTELFKTLKIDVRFIDNKYLNEPFSGKEINERKGTEIFFNTGDEVFSIERLKKEVISNEFNQTLEGKLVKSDEVYDLIDNTDLKDMTTSSTLLKPGKNTRGHSHDKQEEVYVFMSGKGRMKIDDNFIDVKKDSVVSIQKGQFHQVFNDSNEEELFFIAIFTDKRNH